MVELIPTGQFKLTRFSLQMLEKTEEKNKKKGQKKKSSTGSNLFLGEFMEGKKPENISAGRAATGSGCLPHQRGHSAASYSV